ncbi:response regulator [Aerosakkonemataceae cyanobacterium BLCC-F154]|uniref:Response regulator n=1 Tax=Floridaenema fluviatile BLCC-F154 TaxID=3153640 RepID=A0ABV4YHU7_9CYAN
MPVRILIVDDNRDTLRTYSKAFLRRIRHKEWECNLPESLNPKSILEVESADTVQLALEKLEAQPFEILVVDLKIPGFSGEEMGGLELISESLRLDPLRPIIAITGYGSIALARKTLTQGVFDFIEKSDKAVDDLIDAVQRAIDCRDEKIRRAGNPFTPMTGVEPTIFGGRTEELEFFEQKLNRAIYTKNCEHFIVLGNWGIGKSTLLREYKKLCQSRGYIASIVPLEPWPPGTSLTEAARSIVEGVLRDLPYPVDRFKRVIQFFESVGINILGSGLEFKRDTSRKALSPQAFLHDTLLRLWQDLEDKTEVFVILLDDLENFMAVSEIVMTLKSTLSMDSLRNTKLLLGLASTPASWLELTSVQKHHPLSRYFLSRVELTPLNETEVQDTIYKSLSGTGVSFSSEVIKLIFEYTEGHPFQMQLLCYHLFSNQLSRRVEVDTWDKALQATLKDIGIAIFERWLDQLSFEEAQVISIIAKADNPIQAQEIKKLIESRGLSICSENTEEYLRFLIEKQIIRKSNYSRYTVPDPMFRTYIRTYLN